MKIMKILNKKTFHAPELADLICEHGYITKKESAELM